MSSFNRIRFVSFMMSVALTSLLGAEVARAYDGQQQGTLAYVHVKSNVGSQALVLGFSDQRAMCGTGTPSLAVLPAGSPSWDGILSVAMAALLSGREVQVYADMVGGLCTIRQVAIR